MALRVFLRCVAWDSAFGTEPPRIDLAGGGCEAAVGGSVAGLGEAMSGAVDRLAVPVPSPCLVHEPHGLGAEGRAASIDRPRKAFSEMLHMFFAQVFFRGAPGFFFH